MNTYRHNFYKDRHQKTAYAARTVLSHVLDALPPVHSAIDFGCGVGTWLSVLKEQGVRQIQGVDGPWVEQALLKIPQEDFRHVDFDGVIHFHKQYDLAITLEVAEHLSEKSATNFVHSLVGASDFILFSAAIPFQGGRGHINEQWPDYWAHMFAARGYVALDFVRQKIWNDKRIPFWYRQNVLMFVKERRIDQISVPACQGDDTLPLPLVHPDFYLFKLNQMSSVRGSSKLIAQALGAWIRKQICKRN